MRSACRTADEATGVAQLRSPEASEAPAIQAVWESSYAADDPAAWSRGGWSVAAWATDTRVLDVDGRVAGVVAVRAEPAPDGAMPVRVALEVPERAPDRALLLVNAGVELVRAAGARKARLFVPARADWMQAAAREAGFEPVRTIAHMLLPASAATPPARPVAGLCVRSMQDGEDERVLATLNRNWADTWNFVEIPREMLQHDLEGNRDGMLLGIDHAGRIVATCHAVYDPTDRNPDGCPRAWISNLTVDPELRKRGIARLMLAEGIRQLRARGACSITLGVDADNPAPFQLYLSVGFETYSSVGVWDKALS